MKLLLDQGLPWEAAPLLRQAGVEAAHVRELGLQQAEDGALLAFARSENRIIVTLDADFHLALAQDASTTPSVIRVRAQRIRHEELVRLLLPVLTNCAADLQAGAVVSVSRTYARVRRLPIGGRRARS